MDGAEALAELEEQRDRQDRSDHSAEIQHQDQRPGRVAAVGQDARHHQRIAAPALGGASGAPQTREEDAARTHRDVGPGRPSQGAALDQRVATASEATAARTAPARSRRRRGRPMQGSSRAAPTGARSPSGKLIRNTGRHAWSKRFGETSPRRRSARAGPRKPSPDRTGRTPSETHLAGRSRGSHPDLAG